MQRRCLREAAKKGAEEEQKTEEEEQKMEEEEVPWLRVAMQQMAMQPSLVLSQSLLHSQVWEKAKCLAISAETLWLFRNLSSKYDSSIKHGSCCTEFIFVSINDKEASNAQILLFN